MGFYSRRSHFIRNKQRGGKKTLSYPIIPSIGALVSIWLFTSLHFSALLLGVSWIIVGVIYTFLMRKRKQKPTLDTVIEEAEEWEMV